MSKMKVSELAKELDKSSRDIIVALKRCCRLFVEGHNSVITEEQAQKVREFLNKQDADKKSGIPGQIPAATSVSEKKPAPAVQTKRRTGVIDKNGNYIADGTAVEAEPARQPKRRVAKPDQKPQETAVKPTPAVKPAAAAKPEPKPEVKPEPKPVAVEKKTETVPVVPAVKSETEKEKTAQKDVKVQTPPKKRSSGPIQDKDTKKHEGGSGREGRRHDEKDKGSRFSEEQGTRHSGSNKNKGQGAGISVEAPQDKKVRRKDKDKEARNRKNERDYEERENVKGAKNAKGGKNSAKNANQNKKTVEKEKKEKKVEKVTNIELSESITLQELAEKMKVPVAQVVKKMFMKGKAYTQNTPLTFEEAEEIAFEYDILCDREKVVDVIEEMLREGEENEEDLVPRAPVVCVMGHVDHGKTSILDAIRNTHVTQGEAGGITQHIGAYVVEVNGQKITFLDTPGHEAFTAMRLRGAQSTDIAILVVAADDGVMPQTIEAISHAKAAGIEIIVAINKIDKPGANVDRVKQELTEYELLSEDWGGKTVMVPVSAKTGQGLDNLLEMILLVAEMHDLKANPNRLGRGLILEAKLDKGRGPVATVLVQKGTIGVGSHISVGTAFGRIKAMVDDKGKHVKKAGPSTPVEITGLNEVPHAGEVFVETETEREARSMAEKFIIKNREQMLATTATRLSLDSLFDQIKEGQVKDLNIVLKADVQGSVEAMKQSLVKLSNDEVAVKVIHGGVGAINESDVTLATASNAIIIGFNVKPDNHAKSIAEQENVDIRLYTVIYKAIEDIEAAMKGMLEPEFREVITGHAEVRQTYRVSGIGTVIGAYVQDGRFVRNTKVRLLRDNVIIYEGALASLKRFKDDVKEVNTGYECGMTLEKYNDIKEGDVVEAFAMEEVPR